MQNLIGRAKKAYRRYKPLSRRQKLQREYSVKDFEVVVSYSDGRVDVDFGHGTFFLECPLVGHGQHRAADFVVPAIAMISATTGAHYRINDGVSAKMAATLKRLRYLHTINLFNDLVEPRVTLTNVVDIERRSSGRRILCLSGGVDSTAGAIEAMDLNYTHGLMVWGTDYSFDDAAAFAELRARGEAIASRCGLELLVMKTNLREHVANWHQHHFIVFATCLAALSDHFSEFAIASDNTDLQALMRHPWGNSPPYTKQFETYGGIFKPLTTNIDRCEKLKLISDFDGSHLLPLLSVCYEDRSTGGNCGVCVKCVRTRLNLAAIGVDDQIAFPTKSRLSDLVSSVEVPSSLDALKGQYLRMSEIELHMSEGPLKKDISRLVAKLRDELLLIR